MVLKMKINKYVVVLFMMVLLLSGCISGKYACVTDCRYSNVDEYEAMRDACMEEHDEVYETRGVEAYCIEIAGDKLYEDCHMSCMHLKR